MGVITISTGMAITMAVMMKMMSRMTGSTSSSTTPIAASASRQRKCRTVSRPAS